MAQKSSFFDTTPDDPREYPAREFAEYFSRFIGNGIFGGGTSLKVEPAGGNHKVVVSLGYGWINGYLYRVYDAPITLSLDQASGANRIDRIVLRLDTSIHKRSIEVVVKKGTSPTVAPTLTRAGDVYELSLAQVLVQNGGSVIIGSQITDERLNTSLCGIVTGVINQADTTSIFNQFQSWYNTKTVAYQQEWDDWFSAIKVTLTAQWQDWFDGLQNDTPILATNYVRQPGYGVTAGTATAYTLNLNPALTALVPGVCVAIKAHVASGTNPTLNIDGKGAVSMKKANGNAAVLVKDAVYTLRYSGTAFILQGEGGNGNATAADLLIGKTASVDAGDIVGTMPNRTGHVTGQSISRSGTTLRIRPQPGYVPGDAANSVQWNDPNWIAENIVNGKDIFGLVGTAEIRKFASGSGTMGSTKLAFFSGYSSVTRQIFPCTVTGLTFQPKIIVIFRPDSTNNNNNLSCLYNSYSPVTSTISPNTFITNYRTDIVGNTPAPYIFFVDGTVAYVNATGFQLPGIEQAAVNFDWYAFA